MDIKVDTKHGEVIVKGSDGWEVDVREFDERCAYTGSMVSGEYRKLADGDVAFRAGAVLAWCTPPQSDS
jgi:hypothetical protein